MIRLAIRNLTDMLEYPIFPVRENSYKQEIKGHIPMQKHTSHDIYYVLNEIHRLHDFGIKDVTIHTLGISQTNLNTLAGITYELSVALNIENRRVGRTKTWQGTQDILNGMRASTLANYASLDHNLGITLDIGHAIANGDLDKYISELGDFIRVAHIYRIEDDTGHRFFNSQQEFFTVANKLKTLPRCDWWVIEVDQVNEILGWFKELF